MSEGEEKGEERMKVGDGGGGNGRKKEVDEEDGD